MRVLVCLALSVAALLAKSGQQSGEPAFVAASRGAVTADIVVPAQANGVEQYAAEELRYHVGKALGREPEIVAEDKLDPKGARRHFYVGATEAAKKAGIPVWKLADEERVVRTFGGDLYLLGGDAPIHKAGVLSPWSPSARGTLYAVYDFLENEMGVRWLWPGPTGEFVPKADTIAVGAIDRSGREPLVMRFWHGLGGADEKQMYGWTDVAARRRFHEEQSKFMLRHRCGQRINMSSGHAFGKFVERFFDTHPEYFQLKPDGTRGPWHPGKAGWNCSMCVSNPDLPKIVVRDWYEKYAKAAGKGRFPLQPIVNACENDTPGACRCANCRAWDGPDPRFKQNAYWNGSRDSDPEMSSSLGIYGRLADMNRWGESATKPPTPYSANVADRYAKLYNAVLAEARKKVPEARVVAYAYQNYLEGPIETKVDPAVIIDYVPRMYLPYDKDESDFLRLGWENWRRAGVKDLIFRPNFTHAFGGFPVDQARQYCEDIAWCADRGLYGITLDSVQGAYSADAMHNYAITRSFRDPKRGYAKARADMVSAFGGARAEIDRYFDFIENHSKAWTHESFEAIRRANPIKGGIFGGGFHRQANILGEFYSDAFFTDAYRLLDDAKNAAGGDAEVLARIDFLRKGIVNTELTRKTRLARKAADAEPGDAAKQAAFDAAFKAMNDYRTSIQFDCALNLHREAIHEFKQLQWPHAFIELKTGKTGKK